MKKNTKNNIKLVIFTTIHNPLVPNINFVIKKHLPIITDNPSSNEIFPNGSVFCKYERLPNLRDLIVRADFYTARPFKELDQDVGCISSKKRCNSCINIVDHMSLFV